MCLAVTAIAWLIAPDPHSRRAGLSLFVLIGTLWITQTLPLSVTALAVPVLAVIVGVMSPREALAPFAHPVIFLFLGGFALAAALARQELARALAASVLGLVGGRQAMAVVLLAALTAALSMWMSNAATAVMMLPLALSLLRSEDTVSPTGRRNQAFVLLAMAYSASIGGIGTLVGSPPNAIAAAQAGISFQEWLLVWLPAIALLWPLMLCAVACPPTVHRRARAIVTCTDILDARTASYGCYLRVNGGGMGGRRTTRSYLGHRCGYRFGGGNRGHHLTRSHTISGVA
jgi:sodium-dependent dicarboxylate transporter 2/3/5